MEHELVQYSLGSTCSPIHKTMSYATLKGKEDFIMKKLFIGALIVVSAVAFASCGNSSKPTQTSEKPVVNEEAPAEQECPISMDDFVINGQLQAPDSIGNVYYEGSITNNSSFAIKNIDFAFHYTNKEGNKDTTYLSCYDTILPGETSAVKECFGSDDMELISVEVTIVDDGVDHHFEYDAKLGTVEQWY